jgi:hypothetical protein
MDDPRPSGRAEFDRGREPPDEERLDEVVDLLSVRDAGERRVLPPTKAPACRMTVTRKRD